MAGPPLGSLVHWMAAVATALLHLPVLRSFLRGWAQALGPERFGDGEREIPGSRDQPLNSNVGEAIM